MSAPVLLEINRVAKECAVSAGNRRGDALISFLRGSWKVAVSMNPRLSGHWNQFVELATGRQA